MFLHPPVNQTAAAIGSLVVYLLQDGLLKTFQSLEVIQRDRCAGLDLYGTTFGPISRMRSTSFPFPIPIKGQVAPLSSVEAIFQSLDDHKIFKQISSQGMPADMIFIHQSKRIGGQPYVVESKVLAI